VAVTIRYVVNNEHRYLSIGESKVLAELIDAFAVVDHAPNKAAGAVSYCSIDFLLRKDAVIHTSFGGEPTTLNVREGDLAGFITIQRRFYEKLNEVVSAHEGRPIDVMKNN
jgi:hypothetical protein